MKALVGGFTKRKMATIPNVIPSHVATPVVSHRRHAGLRRARRPRVASRVFGAPFARPATRFEDAIHPPTEDRAMLRRSRRYVAAPAPRFATICGSTRERTMTLEEQAIQLLLRSPRLEVTTIIDLMDVSDAEFREM